MATLVSGHIVEKISFTIRVLALVLALALLHSGETFGQDAPGVPAAPPPEAAASAAPAPEEGVAPAPPAGETARNAGGDELTLKSGKTLSKIQIVRKTARAYEVELVPGVTLDVPINQVVGVKYDDIDPIEERRRRAIEESRGGPGGIQAQQLDPALNRALNAPFEEAVSFPDGELTAILKNLAEQKGAAIIVDPSIEAIPVEQRSWAFEVMPGRTMWQILRDDLSKQFPALRIVNEFNALRITAAPPEAEGGPAPENAPAPPPGEKALPPATG